ncbi:MAG: hypothetical protein ACHRHE_06150 [Tepidisphaerales bacterium]
MSHIVSIKTQIRDPVALAAACTRLGLSQPVQGKARLFVTEASGHVVQLPGWEWNEMIAGQVGKLKDLLGDGVEGAIFKYPNFEHIEAAGQPR